MSGVDLSNYDFENAAIMNSNLKNTNAQIDPQLIIEKDLSNANLEGLDLGSYSFDDTVIFGAILKNTNAHIDPQKFVKKIYIMQALKT